MSSPYKQAADSPSRQLLWELSRLGVSNQEEFYARLDQESHEREIVHRNALAAAVARHTRVRESAENARRELELRIENERQRREEEERRELRYREQEKAERELHQKRAEAERLRQAELERKKQEQARKDAEAVRIQSEEKVRKDDAARKELERKNAVAKQQALEAREAERKANEAKAIEARSRVVAQASTQNSTTVHPPATLSTSGQPEREAEHQRYLAIHKNLKQLRQFVVAESKKHDELKQNMGDIRRQIRKSVGQLTIGHNANKKPVSFSTTQEPKMTANKGSQLSNILEALRRAIQLPSPKVDVSLFLSTAPSNTPDGNQVSALLIYLLNIFAKAVISQFLAEASLDPKQADPIGTIASHIFATKDFLWNEVSLIDILLAKFHLVCPVLFGIWGSEATKEGKIKLGWWREVKNGPFVTDQSHNDRMCGLGAGFAALSLRNYEKSKLTNPYPATHYWRSLSYIVNVPPSERTGTHCVVLKAMIENFEEKFLTFFGDAALIALRYSVLEYPQGLTGMGPRALSGLVDTMRRDKKIRL
ncbi:MAG: hypothetical protein Q9195_003889 [Heterodermia aff. obscurata]